MALVALAVVVLAQAQLPATPRDAGHLDPAGRQFLQQAASGGRAEVALGRMTANKAASPEVREFAARMVKDHADANAELIDLAKRKGVSLTTQLDAKHENLVDPLARLSGPEFDREYTRAMLADHRDEIATFGHQASTGSDPDVKAFAQRSLPMLRQHLQLAEEKARSTSSTAGRK
jgi:putative membrane protein